MKKIILTITLGLFVTPITNAQELPSYVPTDGLVAYYPFNGNANDASGNGNHGTVNGATLTPDRNDVQNSSYGFDGLDDYISINSNNNQLDFFGNCCITISAWIKLDNNDNQYGILTNSDYNNIHQQYALKVDSNSKLYFLAGDKLFESNGINYSSSNINNGQWTHTLVSYDGNKLKLYLNGNLDYENQIIDYFPESPSSVAFIGNSWGANNDFFPGKIDEVGIWNRALTEKEIQNLYTSSTGDIKLNGVVSAENNQIRNVADPTHTQDAATKGYVDSNLNSFSGSYNDLTDTPTMYTQAQVNALISNLQSQISDLKGEVVDNEGNVYSSVQLGDQLWTTINAENTTYRDGTAIPQVTDLNTWPNLTTGAWCYIDNDPSKGKLYNWFAVVGIHNEASLTDTSLRKEFAPQGWKIPSNDDFSLLVNYLTANGYNHDGTVTGNKLAKSLASQSGWGVTTGNGLPGTDQSLNNSSGFNALPVGVYKFNGTGWYFLNKGSEADFWTLTEHDSDEDLARYAALIFDRDWLTQWYIPKNNGASVRFIKE